MVIVNTASITHDARVRKEMASLVNAGHSVTLVGLLQPGERIDSLEGACADLFALATRYRFRSPLGWPIKYLEFTIRSLIRLLRCRPDVIHAHDLDALPVALLAAHIRGVPVVYDAHELYGERRIAMAGFWRWLDRRLVWRADLVFTANAERAEVMLREYGAKKLPTPLINCPDRSPAPAARRLRDVLGLAPDAPVVVYQGGLAPGRGLETVIASMAYWPGKSILVLVGRRTMYADQLIATAAHSLGDRIRLAPPVDAREVSDYISDANIGLAFYENTCRNNYLCAPNKFFEYCAARVPVVASNFPPITNILTQYPAGLAVGPDDPVAIGAAITRLLSDSELAAAARTACSRVAEAYSWEFESRKLVAEYRLLSVAPGAAT